jgi:hypothetical protein
MNDKIKNYLIIAIFLMALWGIGGIFDGSGFVGGIGNQIDAIGSIISFLIKAALVLGVIWLIIETFKDKEEKKDDNSTLNDTSFSSSRNNNYNDDDNYFNYNDYEDDEDDERKSSKTN